MSKHPAHLFIIMLLVSSVLFSACGKLSNVVDINFDSQETPPHPPSVKNAPFLGLQSAAGTRTAGHFRLEAGLGTPLSSTVKTSGAFKFYGGIQGQVVSR